MLTSLSSQRVRSNGIIEERWRPYRSISSIKSKSRDDVLRGLLSTSTAGSHVILIRGIMFNNLQTIAI